MIKIDVKKQKIFVDLTSRKSKYYARKSVNTHHIPRKVRTLKTSTITDSYNFSKFEEKKSKKNSRCLTVDGPVRVLKDLRSSIDMAISTIETRKGSNKKNSIFLNKLKKFF